jgi:hypothetical protein
MEDYCVQHPPHPAAKYLTRVTSEYLLNNYILPRRNAMLTSTKGTVAHPMIFCNWGNNKCRQVLEYEGEKTRPISYTFVCRNCKGLALVKAQQLAAGQNVFTDIDARIDISDHYMLYNRTVEYIDYLDVPQEDIWRLVEKQDGAKHRYTTLEKLQGDELWLWWARGLTDHPLLAPKRKK